MTPKPYAITSSSSTTTSSSSSLEPQQENEAVIVVTPYSTGCCIAQAIQHHGYKLMVLWNHDFSEIMKTHQPASCNDLHYDVQLNEQETIAKTAESVTEIAKTNGWNIVACVCGGEAGVDLCDALSEYMGLRTNGTNVPNRRDKKVQQDLIHAAGLRSIRQCQGNNLTDVQDYLNTEPYPLIVKPLDSAGSDGVKLCKTKKEAQDHVQKLLSHYDMVNGGVCRDILCQEYLRGTEYVVDHVSRDGVHKTCMIWKYDKRSVNGADFVYFGDVPVDANTPEAQVLIPYIRGVLDAMGIQNGPSHGEVIITEDGTPCLVEMNCRVHGGDGIWLPLCSALTGGYNQVDVSFMAYLDPEAFDQIPDKPCSPYQVHGQCVDLVSFGTGTVQFTPGYDLIRTLPSFVSLETHIVPGTKVVPTIDMATDIGAVVLMHHDPHVVEADLSVIRNLQSQDRMFEYEDTTDDDEVIWERRRLVRPACSLEGLLRSSPLLSSSKPHRRLMSSDPPDMYLLSQF